MKDKCYIILVNHNGYMDTIECLESVLKLEYANFQVIVVDNSDSQEPLNELEEWALNGYGDLDTNYKHIIYPLEQKPVNYRRIDESYLLDSTFNEKILFVKANENRGFSAANNIGLQYAEKQKDYKYCWLLNNDTVVELKSLSILIDYADMYGLSITGSALCYYGSDLIQGYGGKVNPLIGTTSFVTDIKLASNIDYVVGASFLMSSQVIEAVGFLPDIYFLYYEEVDYCFKARAMGYKIGSSVESLVYHKEGSTIGINSINRQKKSERMDLVYLNSRGLFIKRNFNSRLKLFLGLFIAILNRIKRFQFMRALKVGKLLIELW